MVTKRLEHVNDEENESLIFDGSISENDWLRESEALDIWDW